MVKIYVSVGKDGFIDGWGKAEYGTITLDPKDSKPVELNDDHEFFNGDIGAYKLVGKELVKDNSQQLLQTKEAKKAELSLACGECILAGFKAKINGTEYRFSYDKEAQANLAERWQLFQNNMIDSITITAHAITDDSFKRISVDFKQFATIYLASVKHKEDCISRLHDLLIPMVGNAVTVEQVNDIHWDNQVVIPIEPSIVVKDDATLDKQLQETQAKSKQMSQTIDLNGMAMMELMNIVFTGGLGG